MIFREIFSEKISEVQFCIAENIRNVHFSQFRTIKYLNIIKSSISVDDFYFLNGYRSDHDIAHEQVCHHSESSSRGAREKIGDVAISSASYNSFSVHFPRTETFPRDRRRSSTPMHP